MRNYLCIAFITFAFSCRIADNTVTEKISVVQSEPQLVVEEKAVPLPSKFPEPKVLLSTISSELGLGAMSPWKAHEDQVYFSGLELEVGEEDKNTFFTNFIELTVFSPEGQPERIDNLVIRVGFMNPKDKKFAKDLYIKKVKLLAGLLTTAFPAEVLKAIASETSKTIQSEKYIYEIDYSGASRMFISLTLK